MIHIPSFITVRSTSSRLPGKCFLPFGDSNVLEHVIRRALHGGLEPIVCTSDQLEDDPIAELAAREGIPCFRGEPVHKLKRWGDCAAAMGVDHFHTVDADDPFFDWDEVKRSLALLREEGWDMVAPTGSSSSGGASMGYSLTRDAVARAVALTEPDDDTEMMWYWMDKVDGLRKTTLSESAPPAGNLRITLDYEEDYWLLRSVLRIVGPLAPREEVDALFHRNPELHLVNWFRNEQWADAQAAKKVQE